MNPWRAGAFIFSSFCLGLQYCTLVHLSWSSPSAEKATEDPRSRHPVEPQHLDAASHCVVFCLVSFLGLLLQGFHFFSMRSRRAVFTGAEPRTCQAQTLQAKQRESGIFRSSPHVAEVVSSHCDKPLGWIFNYAPVLHYACRRLRTLQDNGRTREPPKTLRPQFLDSQTRSDVLSRYPKLEPR